MNDQSRQSRINHDTAQMLRTIYQRPHTINAETRAKHACGNWQARDARNRSLEQDREEWRAIKWILFGAVVFGTLAGAFS